MIEAISKAQLVKRWLTVLEVQGSTPAGGEILHTLKRVFILHSIHNLRIILGSMVL